MDKIICGNGDEYLIPGCGIAEWNGSGLPPIGIEVKIPDDMACGNDFLEQFEGLLVEIVGHTETPNGTPVAVFKYSDRRGALRYHALAGDNGNFEPIRNAQRIAAEDRLRAIGEMSLVIDRVPEGESKLAHLYDAGYRKIEGAKL